MLNKLDQYYYEAKGNKWYGYFAVFCRLALAVAWVISGFVKIKGERFAAGLSHNHPLGQYFDALLNTGYYYTFHDFTCRSTVRMVICVTPRPRAMKEQQRLLKVRRIGFRPMEVFSALPSSMTSWRSSSSWTMVDTVAFVRCSIFARSARESGGWLAIASRTRARFMSRIYS